MPLNVMDAHFRSFEHDVLPVLVREGIAPLGMKAFGDHFILDSKTVKPIEGLHYCLNLPISVQITGIDSQQMLDQAMEAVKTFRPMSEAQVAKLLEKTSEAAQAGQLSFIKSPRTSTGPSRIRSGLAKKPRRFRLKYFDETGAFRLKCARFWAKMGSFWAFYFTDWHVGVN